MTDHHGGAETPKESHDMFCSGYGSSLLCEEPSGKNNVLSYEKWQQLAFTTINVDL